MLKKIIGNPLLLALTGWLLIPLMYLAFGVLFALGLPKVVVATIALPIGLIGFLAWIAAVVTGIYKLVCWKQVLVSVLALVAVVPPLALIVRVYQMVPSV
ncbi:hypothetical protein E4634_19840 [Mangrovimicrobium sediminis]|uniref:Uncharacterized protein n=1 Tax=Mangrovimicrobium sediminis TaxID=2562682 RepID=A0A4Z0LVF3_9GAMM|nr:hypothetical protein [Haliea sp. SAOS-164]TGD71098.1 hypothetical protein E4634_19840 [Haliea sp. SAOS-164]